MLFYVTILVVFICSACILIMCIASTVVLNFENSNLFLMQELYSYFCQLGNLVSQLSLMSLYLCVCYIINASIDLAFLACPCLAIKPYVFV